MLGLRGQSVQTIVVTKCVSCALSADLNVAAAASASLCHCVCVWCVCVCVLCVCRVCVECVLLCVCLAVCVARCVCVCVCVCVCWFVWRGTTRCYKDAVYVLRGEKNYLIR